MFPKAIEHLFGKIVQSLAGVNENKLYGLDHAILNVEVPPQQMWMNMGYWKDTDCFPKACEALLDQVLRTAGLDSGPQIKLVDVGIGCGDQTLYLTQLPRPDATEPRQPLIKSYVGITIAPPQAEFAQERVRKAAAGASTLDVQIYAADAANPASWVPELAQAVGAEDSKAAKAAEGQMWLLALDTLYHFKPSRKPLLRHACRDMQASFMAFDLLLADHPSFFDKLVLRLMCLLTGIPFSNFLARRQYEDMLVEAGYERHLITMQDISEHVFSGIAGYIYKKDALLKTYGMGMGKFRGPAKVFNWWARTGLVRGYIVVARSS